MCAGGVDNGPYVDERRCPRMDADGEDWAHCCAPQQSEQACTSCRSRECHWWRQCGLMAASGHCRPRSPPPASVRWGGRGGRVGRSLCGAWPGLLSGEGAERGGDLGRGAAAAEEVGDLAAGEDPLRSAGGRGEGDDERAAVRFGEEEAAELGIAPERQCRLQVGALHPGLKVEEGIVEQARRMWTAPQK